MYPIYFKLITNRTQIYAARNFSNIGFSKSFLSQCKKPQRQWHCLKLQTSNFHTTPKMNSPTLMLLSFASIASGMYMRKLWLEKTLLQQEQILKWAKSKRHMIYGSLAVISLTIVMYCSAHIKRDPILNKPRFVLFTEADQTNALYKLLVQSKHNVVPLNDPVYSRIKNVIKNLAKSNRELFEHTNWNVTVIHRMFNLFSSPTIMVLPDRNIIVLSDIFKFIKNDDQLTFNLAHEIAHNLLLHPLEALSYAALRSFTCDVAWFLFYALYPTFYASMLAMLFYLSSLSIFFWYRRRCELEADKVGFQLAAKSCIDLREVFVFWELMKKYSDIIDRYNLFNISLFDSHPPIEERIKKISDELPRALQLRSQADCSDLPDKDPRDNLPQLLKDIEDELKDDLSGIKIIL